MEISNINNINIIYNFSEFLKKFNIIPLAFSLVVSLNLNQLVNSFGLNIITPIILLIVIPYI